MLAPARKREAAPPSIEAANIPAPVGLDTVSSGSAMPADKCIRLYNMVRAEYGLRSRLGNREWVTGLTGSEDNTVRTVMPFQGSQPALNRLFVATSSGIWDVTSSTTSPTVAIAFADTAGEAGWGISQVVVTAAGHFLLYCDEVNGLYQYTETTDSWVKVAAGTRQLWAPSTSYSLDDRVVSGSNVYKCSTAGLSDTGAGPSGTGTGITDGTAAWDYVSAASTTAIGPVLSDQHAGITCDPANFVFVIAWKNRVFFVERNSARVWYLDILAISGAATSLEMGHKFAHGGHLVGLWSWTIDGGSGVDDRLVAISRGGDIVIYQGTDPSSASTFGIQGTWYAGAVPAGRRIASDFGGDLLVLSKTGVLELSLLVMGKLVADRSQYETSDIAPLFNTMMAASSTCREWAIGIHPEDSTLLLLVPTGPGLVTNQLAMGLTTKGWSEYRDLPIYTMGVLDGKLYFGTVDGRVCVNDGYIDGVTLASPNAYLPIQCRLLTAFRNLGNGRKKMVRSIRPTILCDGGNVGYVAEPRYDYNFSGYGSTDGVPVSQATGQGWDSATWDSAIWGGEFTANKAITGATGIGIDVAVALRFAAVARTVLVGLDVYYAQGGLL
jgi:hypothetical protein